MMKRAITGGLLAFAVMGFGCDSDDGDSGAADTTTVEDTSVADDTSMEEADTTEAMDTSEAEDTARAEDTVEAFVCEPAETLRCEDDLILELGLIANKVSTGGVTNTADGDDIVSVVDARAGGFGNTASNPWGYFKIGEAGLEQVMIDDMEALDSIEWDLAFKRFGLRLNSGVSGPGCVTGQVIYDLDYAEVDTIPSTEDFREEAFFNDSCEMIQETSGLGTPAYLTSGWWTYPGCVATTGAVYLIDRSGDYFKLTVEAYYASGQDGCNANGTVGSDSAMVTVRWRAL